MSIDEGFRQLRDRLRDPQLLNPAAGTTFIYFAYPPELALQAKERLEPWMATLKSGGLEVQRLSLSLALWKIIDRSNVWPTILDSEHSYPLEECNRELYEVLKDELVEEVGTWLEGLPQGTIALITETECLHPWLRARALESKLSNVAKCPVVVFYPGLWTGTYTLKYLGFYEEDGNYRSTVCGVMS